MSRLQKLVWAGLSVEQIGSIYGVRKPLGQRIDLAREALIEAGFIRNITCGQPVRKYWEMYEMERSDLLTLAAKQMTNAIVEAAPLVEPIAIIATGCNEFRLQPISIESECPNDEILLSLQADQKMSAKHERKRLFPIIRECLKEEADARGFLR